MLSWIHSAEEPCVYVEGKGHIAATNGTTQARATWTFIIMVQVLECVLASMFKIMDKTRQKHGITEGSSGGDWHPFILSLCFPSFQPLTHAPAVGDYNAVSLLGMNFRKEFNGMLEVGANGHPTSMLMLVPRTGRAHLSAVMAIKSATVPYGPYCSVL